eukprot:1151181-Pelagomonas_calceolata.AAC.2
MRTQLNKTDFKQRAQPTTCGKLRKWSGLEVTLGSALRAWSPSCCAVEGAAATAESAAEEAGWPRALETGAAGEL